MAERFARDEAPLVIHPTETSIHEHFNNIIYRLNQRREEMIREFRERMKEKRAAATTRDKTLQQLIESKADIQSRMKENLLHSMREKITEDIYKKMKQLQVVEKETEIVFECDTRQLEQTISVLGQLIEKEIISIPKYSGDGTHSYVSAAEVRERKARNPTPSEPSQVKPILEYVPNRNLFHEKSDTRTLPQPPVEPKVIVPHQYVTPEEVKRRKVEQRFRKAEERRLSGYTLSTPGETDPVSPDIEPDRKPVTTSQFPSLKSIFSDFRKDEDVVAENMLSVLGLPPPEPPNDSGDETQSYASTAEIRERKARKPTPSEPSQVKPIQEYVPGSMEVNAASFQEDIGYHTYSSVTDDLTEASPYEEPKFVLKSFEPIYEDPYDIFHEFD